ncbi:Rap1a/Tai family immunity protein [Falsiroseomonas oryziterrae]|uniref:Rap1a/Tai family immunity protein n=1 Tax=Falsiroseomonas oryziterrae TaxID=2911368 RepID=UPI001F3B2B95|nr:Rap1a/Tai family immunity protein [Roseomonas sp. NPKOSM-4]
MRSMTIAALAAGLCLSALPATAQVRPDNFSGGRTSDLAVLCGAAANDPNVVAASNYCHGFLMSAGQFHAEITQPGGRVQPMFCLPTPRPDLATVSSGFARWAAANPQYAAASAVEGVVRYATASWPCPDAPRRATRGSQAR